MEWAKRVWRFRQPEISTPALSLFGIPTLNSVIAQQDAVIKKLDDEETTISSFGQSKAILDVDVFGERFYLSDSLENNKVKS